MAPSFIRLQCRHQWLHAFPMRPPAWACLSCLTRQPCQDLGAYKVSIPLYISVGIYSLSGAFGSNWMAFPRVTFPFSWQQPPSVCSWSWETENWGVNSAPLLSFSANPISTTSQRESSGSLFRNHVASTAKLCHAHASSLHPIYMLGCQTSIQLSLCGYFRLNC